MKKSYAEKVMNFYRSMRSLNETCLNYENNELSLCNQLNEIICDCSDTKFIGAPISEYSLEPRFFHAIKNLGVNTKNAYKLYAPNIKIQRSEKYNRGNGKIIKYADSPILKIKLTSDDLSEIDFIAFCHEMGHVPQLLYKKHEFYEFTEAIPIYFEYLACKELYHGAIGEFLFDRLAKERCATYRDIYHYYDNSFKFNNDMSIKELNCMIIYRALKKESNYKYIKSLDLALQIINRENEDRDTLNKEVYNYVSGEKSFSDVAKVMKLDTTTCKTLVKHFL